MYTCIFIRFYDAKQFFVYQWDAEVQKFEEKTERA